MSVCASWSIDVFIGSGADANWGPFETCWAASTKDSCSKPTGFKAMGFARIRGPRRVAKESAVRGGGRWASRAMNFWPAGRSLETWATPALPTFCWHLSWRFWCCWCCCCWVLGFSFWGPTFALFALCVFVLRATLGPLSHYHEEAFNFERDPKTCRQLAFGFADAIPNEVPQQ